MLDSLRYNTEFYRIIIIYRKYLFDEWIITWRLFMRLTSSNKPCNIAPAWLNNKLESHEY